MGLKATDAELDEIILRLSKMMANRERPSVSEEELERVVHDVLSK